MKELLERTREAVSGFDEGDLSAEPLKKGGSGRSYWRIRNPLGESVIAMQYTTERPDNASFVPVTRFLEELGVSVPRILAFEEAERLVWLEDAGEVDLWELRTRPWNERRPLYEAALAEVAKLHAVSEADIRLQPPFDEELYQWEQDYFFDEFIQGHLGVDASALRNESCFRELRDELAALPRFLLHRDFQSENVMIRDDKPMLIDYQGLRLGRPEYDVASLVFDPYVKFSDDERSDLLDYYCCEPRGIGDVGEWRQVLHKCAAQRLMQALGAYGFLSHKKGLTGYLDHIPAGTANLKQVLQLSGLLGPLLSTLRSS